MRDILTCYRTLKRLDSAMADRRGVSTDCLWVRGAVRFCGAVGEFKGHRCKGGLNRISLTSKSRQPKYGPVIH